MPRHSLPAGEGIDEGTFPADQCKEAELTDLRLLPWHNSPAFLSEAGDLRRVPRHPKRARPKGFFDTFEFLALFYDCFWHHDGKRVLLVGPTPRNLLLYLHAGAFEALPSKARIKPRFHISTSVMIAELPDVPAGSTAIGLRVAGQGFTLPIQPSSVPALAGRRVLFSMNKDNDLAWIREWANWHARLHGTDAIVLFDNGSSRYGRAEIEDALLSVEGISRVAVPSWPYAFGPIDPSVIKDPYWARFLQVSSMSVVLRRYGAAAYGLLDCDVDELADAPAGQSLYERAKVSRAGLLSFRGQWIENLPAPDARPPLTHRAYRQRLADPKARLSRQKKWALDPTRPWVEKLSVHPYWHWIEGRPWFAKQMPKELSYWHFRGINTDWKDGRASAERPTPDLVEIDAKLEAGFAQLDVPSVQISS